MNIPKIPPLPWEKLEQLKKTHKIGVVAGTFVIIAAVFYFLLLSGLREDIATLSEQIDTARSELSIMRSAPKLKEIKDAPIRLEQLTKELEVTRDFLPEKDEIDNLLKDVSGQARESGLNVITFKPMEVPEGSEELKGGFLARVPFNIVVEGSYVNVASFLYKVSKLMRIVHIESIRMASPKIENDTLVLTSTIAGTTYRFVETPLPGEAAAGQAVQKEAK